MKYVIAYYGDSGDGMVSVDNDATDNLDNAMQFTSEREAVEAAVKLQNEWTHSTLKVQEVNV